MECKGCKEEKLLNEYPREKLTDSCSHPYFYCFECVIRCLKTSPRCPHCNSGVANPEDKINLYEAHLSRLFRQYERRQPTGSGEDNILRVRRLDGMENIFPFKPQMTIKELKEKIEAQAHWKYPAGKQCLKYNKKELEVYDHGRCRTFAEYGVTGGNTVHLIIRLLSVADNIENAIFELYWHYPKSSKKNMFIDASCFVYKEKELYKIVDFENDQACHGNVKHSGDDMDRINHIGRHCIEVQLKKLPKNVTHLYFLLSTWNADNMKDDFDGLKLQFCDSRDIFTPLCNTELPREILHKKAIIVCYASRGESCWHIDEVKVPCNGNVDAYEPMKLVVKDVLEKL